MLLEVILKTFDPAFVFSSIAMDAPQPQKTGTEKELLYSKVVVRGQSIELLLECTHVDDYGGDAKSLKRVVDDVLLKQYNIPESIVETLMVCCCADGASANMGKYNGKCFHEFHKNIWKCTCDLFLLLYYSCYEFFFVRCLFVRAVSRVVLGTQLFEGTISFFLAAATNSKEKNT